ncbi:signal peptidase [Sinirhodobacter populi]|uniref:Signal peptidase n=1 Tax=Paenirhodobacter populi TaxID=2306993 RepID=A0A443K0N3_9RHOB|nr:imelysin family protein [Sinirhodobacter populi]RWR26304.1 signal peptidase [Sinirhodobacter populi]
MRFPACLATLLFAAGAASADIGQVIANHARPGYAAFVEAGRALDEAARADCAPAGLVAPFHAAQDAWMRVAHLRIGPSEDRGRALSIAFWPDPKESGRRTTAGLIAAENPVVHDPAAFTRISVAARGFPALERLIFADPPPSGDPAYLCDLTRALTGDLVLQAQALDEAWIGDFARLLTGAGQPGNQTYLSAAEARQALFTLLVAGLEMDADQRLGRPLGTIDRPRPEQAEARASHRSRRNLAVSLAGLRELMLALTAGHRVPHSSAALDRAIALAGAAGAPDMSDLATPEGWQRADTLRREIKAARAVIMAEIPPLLGVDLGFNATDGD